jgi:hypothetical protein
MLSEHLVLIVIAVEVGGLAAGFGLLAGHGAWLSLRQRLLAPRVSLARAEIVSWLVGRPQGQLPLTVLARLPLSERLRVLGDPESSVSGSQRSELRELARRAGVLDLAGRACHSRRWRRRLWGARIHTLLGGGEDVVPRLFSDRHPIVRSEAAVWAAEHPDHENVAHLVALLGDEATLCRFTVKDTLLRLGAVAVEPLREYLTTADGAAAAVGLEVAAALSDPRLLDAAFRHLESGHEAIRRRAVDAIGALGGERAAAALIGALGDPAANVRAAAARGLGRSGHWIAGAQLAAALRDESWDVRRQAGLALCALGAPGELLLRRMLDDEDRFAGDMARLMLDDEDRFAGDMARLMLDLPPAAA